MEKIFDEFMYRNSGILSLICVLALPIALIVTKLLFREYYRRQGLLDIYDAAESASQEGSQGFTIIKGEKHTIPSHLNDAEVEKYVDNLNQ